MKHQWIPAKVNDIIKKVPSGYQSEVADGDHFVVIDVYDGDDTAVVLGRDGKLYSIVYPEEYEVIGTVDELIGTKIINQTLRPEGTIVYENITGTKKEFDFWNNLLNKVFRR